MIDPRAMPVVTAGLACAGALVVLALAIRAPNPAPQVRQAGAAPPASAVTSPSPGTTIDVLDTYIQAITGRPAFAPDRRPQQLEAAAAAAEPQMGSLPSLDYYRVVGLVVAGAESLALVKSQKSGLTLRLRAGDMMDGWQVTRVEADAVILIGDGAEQRLAIPRQDGSPQPTSTAASDAP